MAFYFALLNVSRRDDSKNNPPANAPEPSSSSKHGHHQGRRRHSIASVESPLLDYRLLPRPQVVRNEHYFEEGLRALEESMKDHTIRSEDRQKDKNPQQQQQQQNVREKDRRKESNKERERREADEKKRRKDNHDKMPNGKACHQQPGCSKDYHDGNAVRGRQNRKGKGGRTLMPRRRVSPQWSTTTSESRRSSKESNRSERKERESVASSNGSHSTQDMSPCTSNAPLKSRSANQVSEPRMKKVTFENSPYIIANTFLGERMVLRRGSGMAAESEEEREKGRQLDAILGDVPVKEAYGDDLWLPSSENRTKHENLLNYAIQNPR
ncbi:hypothetical protein WR25_05301 [Diploscapter pachys]|uniref:Uncharacterized protein n=1 Tax=Diploscapter pachys TaxID=2018661 RepID=A0A2A2JBW1_9BILA|nr:hypothetical protein WR25_05301 [Diploscapter pachys]